MNPKLFKNINTNDSITDVTRFSKSEYCDKTIRNSYNKIRIVFFIGQLGLGGSERQLFLILKHLDRTVFDIKIVVFNPSANFTFDKALKKLDIEIWHIPSSKKRIIGRVYYLFKLVKKIRPNIIHSWTLHDNPYAGIIGRLTKVPVIFGSLRSSLSSPGMRSLPAIFRWLSIFTVPFIVVNSKVLIKELTAKGYSSDRIFYLPNCVETQLHNDLKDLKMSDLKVFGIHDRHKLIGIVGNLRGIKNHMMFVKAMSLVLPEFPSARALIIGQEIPSEPRIANDIIQAIKSYGLDGKIVLTGFRNDVTSLLRKMAIFCLTSKSEGTPNVIMEAMAAGLPVVATNVGGIKHIVQDGINGILIESDDSDAFANAVKKLLIQETKATDMGKIGKEIIIHQFGCEAIANRLTDLYYDKLHKHMSLAHIRT